MWRGGATSLGVGVVLFMGYGINAALTRDEGIYTYAGQQLAQGVPPYVSIFDAKAPVASMIAGVAAWLAGGTDGIYAVRIAFFMFACGAVVGVFLLGARLWRSPLAGVVAATVFSSFNGFARDALSGPNAKTPGVMFAVVSMWLGLGKRWFWAGLAGSLAFLTWQPLIVYPAMISVAAFATSSREQRWRALGGSIGGAAVPVAAVTTYFAAAGALAEFIDAVVLFPIVGVVRPSEDVGRRLARIVDVVSNFYGFSGVLLYVGIVALVVLIGAGVWRSKDRMSHRHVRVIAVVVVTLVGQLAYAATDFQSYPDVYPLLPYGAVGVGGVAAAAIAQVDQARRSAAVSVVVVAVAMLVVVSLWWFSRDPLNDGLTKQRITACAVAEIAGGPGSVYAMGDPRPMVFLEQRNPDRFIFMGSGTDAWKVRHTPGGFAGWTAQVAAVDPSVVVTTTWKSPLKRRMVAWLRDAGYTRRRIGGWEVFAKGDNRATAVPSDAQDPPCPHSAAIGAR